MRGKSFLLSALSLILLIVAPAAWAVESSGPKINTEAGFNTIQEPFSQFLDSALKIHISDSTRNSGTSLPNQEEVKKSWEDANNWTKEKTGLDILEVLKKIGEVVVYVLNLAVGVISFFISSLQWLLSLIPGSGS